MSGYEPCVTNGGGNCSRWSHDHAAENDVARIVGRDLSPAAGANA